MNRGSIKADPIIRVALEPALPFRVRVSHAQGWDRLALEGELDLASTPILQAEFDRLERNHPGLILVDLRRLSFMDATGLRVLLGAYARALHGPWSLAIVRGPRAVHRLFELAGVEQVLHVIEDPAAARPERRLRAS